MKLFSLDSPLMQALGKMADLLWLNFLALICCLPVVTVGASLTALNYMALKMARDEDCYITRGFFKSFKENFKQATIIWLILLFMLVVLVADYLIVVKNPEMGYGQFLKVVVWIAAVIWALTVLYVFPVLAKFDNSIFRTMKNALIISLVQLPKTILMLLLYAAPVLIFCTVVQAMPLCMMFGLSVPAFLSAKLYNKFFRRLEDRVLMENPPAEGIDAGAEDEHIFQDELDPALTDKSQGS